MSIWPRRMLAFTRTQLASYKQPAALEFVTELPRNPAGKVLRRVLRERPPIH